LARPKRCRRIADLPPCALFKPAGVPGRTLVELVLPMDELEALRLADYEGLYQEEAAARMGVSRQTFGRIVESARKTVARALIEGCALRIEGGMVVVPEIRTFECEQCCHAWDVPFGTGRPSECPSCQGSRLYRVAVTGVSAPDGQGTCPNRRLDAPKGCCAGKKAISEKAKEGTG
jgi:predicted DNA-binding protein (UPF0251 family)